MKKNTMKISAGIITLVSCLTLVVFIYALWSMRYDVNNKFTLNTENVTLEETFQPPPEWKPNEPITKRIMFKNEGTLSVVLRVQVVETIKTPEGVLLPNQFENAANERKDVVLKNYNKISNWVENSNSGWYYYTLVLHPNEQVVFLESVTLSQDVPPEYDGMSYELSYIYEYVTKDISKIKVKWAEDVENLSFTGNSVNWSMK